MCVRQQNNIQSRMNAVMIRLILIGAIAGIIEAVIRGSNEKFGSTRVMLRWIV
jgi:hypothetical protein